MPDSYLPEKFDSIGDEEQKAATAGVALLRKYGGIYLSPRMMVNTNMDWAHRAFDLNSDHFFSCGTQSELVPVVLAAPLDSPMLNRLHSTMMNENLTPSEAYEYLENNKETKQMKKKNKVKLFDPPMIFFVRDSPHAKSLPEQHKDLFYMPRGIGKGVPGSVVRHLYDKNALPEGTGRVMAKTSEPAKNPGTDEKAVSLAMAAFLFTGAVFLVYKSETSG